MKTLTAQDLEAWLAHAADGMNIRQLEDLIRTQGRPFPLPKTAIDAFDLARFLSNQWEKQERILFTLEDSIFTGVEEIELYHSYVRTFAGRRPDTGEALIFEPNSSSFTTVLAIHIIFKWDCVAVSPDERGLEVSHDDLFCARGFDASIYEALSRITGQYI